MQSYKCYWQQNGKLCRTDVSGVIDSNAAIDLVKDSLHYDTTNQGKKFCVLAVVK